MLQLQESYHASHDTRWTNKESSEKEVCLEQDYDTHSWARGNIELPLILRKYTMGPTGENHLGPELCSTLSLRPNYLKTSRRHKESKIIILTLCYYHLQSRSGNVLHNYQGQASKKVHFSTKRWGQNRVPNSITSSAFTQSTKNTKTPLCSFRSQYLMLANHHMKIDR